MRHGSPCTVVIDAGDDARTVALGLGIADEYAATGTAAPPVHVRLSAAREGLTGATLRAFGTMERFADPDLLLQEDHDALARSIHDFYLQGRFDAGEMLGARASLHEWEDLPESFRDDNRLVADCYALKLQDIGADQGPGPRTGARHHAAAVACRTAGVADAGGRRRHGRGGRRGAADRGAGGPLSRSRRGSRAIPAAGRGGS